MENVSVEGDAVKVIISKKIYPKEIVISSVNAFLSKNYLLIDADENNYYIYIKSQGEEITEKIGNEFNNELVNQMNYKISSSQSKEIKNAYLARLIMTNDPESYKKEIK